MDKFIYKILGIYKNNEKCVAYPIYSSYDYNQKNNQSFDDTLARQTLPVNNQRPALKKGGKRETSFESRIPKLGQFKKQGTQETKKQSPAKQGSKTSKKLTFKEPCRSEPRNTDVRGLQNFK